MTDAALADGFAGTAAGPRLVKQTIGERRDDFMSMIAKERVADQAATTEAAAAAVLAAKEGHATNGLSTSTFLVCARMRPAFEAELAQGGDNFEVALKTTTAEAEEAVTVLLPKLSLRGVPKLERSSFAFDHTFGQAANDDDIFAALGRPLTAKALCGEVGVIFAYGQTGAGKTFTMTAVMDRVVAELFPPSSPSGTAPRAVRFSYLEILGSSVHDCLAAPPVADGAASTEASATQLSRLPGELLEAIDKMVDAEAGRDVQIGEALDGRVLTRNLSAHDVCSAVELERLMAVAKSRRATAPTERNASSSRSHGVGILTVGAAGFTIDDTDAPRPGVLMMIDLAGSERAADSRGHDKKRMEETKAVNVSLMALKDCIRARTLASTAPAGEKVFVPYRRTKLTLLMKDIFDISCSRLCTTVVLACVSPLAKDAPHTLNTLGYAAPLRVAVQLPSGHVERDERDPALWDHAKALAWLVTAASIKPDDRFGDGPAAREPSLDQSLEHSRSSLHSSSARAAAGTALVDADPIDADPIDADPIDADPTALLGVAGAFLPRAAVDGPFDAEAVIAGMSGLDLCRLPEAELHVRIKKQIPGKEGAALAARVHEALWMLICDAKTRKRRPNGLLVTDEEEAEEARRAETAVARKNAIWKEREASMAAASTLDAAESMAPRM